MKISKLLLTAAIAMAANAAQAATIANWKELNTASTNSGMNTDSPTIGDGTLDNADDTWVAGRFGTVATPASVTLAIGETLTVSGSITLTGGVDVTSNLRFGVFDESGQFASGGTTWANGGWLLREGVSDGGDGWYQARTNGAFVSTNPNAVQLTTTYSNPGNVTLSGNATNAYDWSISVTRDSATTVDLFGSIVGGDSGYNQTYTSNDNTTSLFTYNALGVLLGGSLNLDQASLSNVEYTVVPEPSSMALLGLGALGLLARRRRS
jgi:hypothetical protein